MADESPRGNPWLTIPASDYEGHMSDPAVDQTRFLSDLFGELVGHLHPATIALLGCATGNGLETIIGQSIQTVIGIDIHRDYLRIARDRYASRIPQLGLVCADLADCELKARSLDLAHGAIILEYLNPSVVIEKCSRWLKVGGVLSIVMQLPSVSCEEISATDYGSLRRLEPIMRLLHPGEVELLIRRNGFREIRTRTHRLKSGKEFFVGIYRLEVGQARDGQSCTHAG